MYDLVFKKQFTREEYYKKNYAACNRLKREEKVMNDIKKALLQKYKEIYNEIYNYNEIYGHDYTPLFSEKQLQNAISIICQGKYSSEDIIDIDDTSLNWNGKSGMVLTVDAVCIKETFDKVIAKYEDIADVHLKKKKFLGDLQYTIIFKMKYGSEYTFLSSNNPKCMMSLIRYAISLYEEDDKLEW